MSTKCNHENQQTPIDYAKRLEDCQNEVDDERYYKTVCIMINIGVAIIAVAALIVAVLSG